MKKSFIGWTYSDWKFDTRGGCIIHTAIWKTKQDFKLINPDSKPKKIEIIIKDK